MADEAFLLSSSSLSGSSSSLASARAVGYTAQKRQVGRVQVLTPAVGLTVYDTADQTPLSSISLGPSFVPTSAPASRSEPTVSPDSIRVKGLRKTWVAVEASGSSGEVWSWTESERKDGSVEGESSRVVYPSPARLSSIVAPRTLPSQLVTLAENGQLTLAAENDIATLASTSAPSTAPSSQTLQVFPISASQPAFLPSTLASLIPSSSNAHLALVVRSFSNAAAPSLVEIGQKKVKKSKRPSAAAVIDAADASRSEQSHPAAGGSRGEVEVILIDGEVELDGQSSAQLLSLGKADLVGSEVVVSEDGFVSALSGGDLLSYRLASTGAAPATYAELFTSTAPFSLSLTPIRTLPLSSTALSRVSISLVALHSSFVLLAALRPAATSASEEAAPVVVCLVWDVRLGAVVSHNEIGVPAAAFPATPNAPRQLVLSLSLASAQAAVLAVAPSTGSTGRSLLYILPTSSLPTESVLAAVVGKHALTRKFLSPTESVAAKAKRTEPMRHPRTSKAKLALLDESEKERTALLEKLETVLAPLADAQASSEAVEGAVGQADRLFASFIDGERKRLTEYNIAKLVAAEEKEKERRAAALLAKEQAQPSAKKYSLHKRRIEAAIAAAASAGTPWQEVTARRIKSVSDPLRYKYYEERKKAEEEAGKKVEDTPREIALKKVQHQEPAVPSTFVSALLRLCFPSTSFALESELAASERVFKHPVGIISYLLERSIVGDGQVDGGVTRHLARANDWPNVQRALESMPDIAESTTVSLLKTVVNEHLTADPSAIEIETTHLPFPIPPLTAFLSSFVESPSTPAILRQQLQRQLTAVEVLPVLEVLNEWLGWWAKRGGGGGQVEGAEVDWKAQGKPKPKRLPTNPFVALALAESADEAAPPRVEDVVPVVQSILDSHFVSLLLQRQAHKLLRRLAAHVHAHVAMSTDLSSLLGPLAIYARAKEDQREAQAAAKAGLAAKAAAQGRDLGASMAARVAAQELHAEVGEYQVDKFWL